MRRLVLALVLTGGLVPSLGAQDSTADVLRQASAFYERLEVERALPLLRQIVSPNWPFEVTAAQRVEAYTYLGAILALAGKRDSAVLYFRAAIERDAFTELDPSRFAPAQLRLFGDARRLSFGVGVRPAPAARIDPRTQRLSFTVISTGSAVLEARLRAAGARSGLVVFSGPSDGPREIAWDGLLADGRLAPPGRYEFVLVGRSRRLDRVDSARVFFDIAHEAAPLEDTLPNLAATDLLPEQLPPSAATRDLAKGLGVAGAALLISGGLANHNLGGNLETGARVVAGAATVSAVAGFFFRRRHRDVPENVAANARRRAERAAENGAIRERNAAKIAATVLVVTPAAGVGP